LEWDNYFREWTDCRFDRKRKKFQIQLDPRMRKRIKVASWVFNHFLRLDWPVHAFHPAMLREHHFEAAKRQMNREKDLAACLVKY
jgi:hypothetical protein